MYTLRKLHDNHSLLPKHNFSPFWHYASKHLALDFLPLLASVNSRRYCIHLKPGQRGHSCLGAQLKVCEWCTVLHLYKELTRFVETALSFPISIYISRLFSSLHKSTRRHAFVLPLGVTTLGPVKLLLSEIFLPTFDFYHS
jgi:hypothetical protein